MLDNWVCWITESAANNKDFVHSCWDIKMEKCLQRKSLCHCDPKPKIWACLVISHTQYQHCVSPKCTCNPQARIPPLNWSFLLLTAFPSTEFHGPGHIKAVLRLHECLQTHWQGLSSASVSCVLACMPCLPNYNLNAKSSHWPMLFCIKTDKFLLLSPRGLYFFSLNSWYFLTSMS